MRAAIGVAAIGAAALGCVALGGCSSATAVDLTVTLGGDVAAHTAELSTLALHVDGDVAPFDRTLDVAGKFGGGRETIEYVPKVGSGTLTFTITLADASAATLGTGMASVPLVAHKAVALTVPVGSGATGDDMTTSDDLSPPPPPDMTMPCAAIQVSTLSGTGAAGYMDGPGNMAQFQMAEGITHDAQGSLYVAEAQHLRKVLSDGTASTKNASGVGLLQGRRVAISNVGDFYVADSANDAIVRVDGTTGAASTSFNLGGVISVAENAMTGKTYVWDTQTANISVDNGAARATFSGSGSGFADGAAGIAKFSDVPDLIFDSAGILWVADAGNFRVRRVAADGSVSTIAGSTQGHADGSGSAAQFDTLLGITVDDGAHVLYVTDGTQIRRVTETGDVTTVVGSTSGLVDGNGCVAKFGAPKGITYFAGALYVVDVERVRKIVLP